MKKVKKLSLINSIPWNKITLTFLLENKKFLKDCKKTIEICNKIESWLKGWFIPSIIPVVNSMCINLKLPPEIKKLNSCLLIAPRGSAKSELLKELLANSNPGFFTLLEPKVFESDLVQKPREYFHNKIIVRDDLISTFEGLSPKQRQQLNNFWVELLEGRYARERDKIENVRTMVLFGFASEMINKFRKELLSSTFFDRVPAYEVTVTEEQKREILEFRSKHSVFSPNKNVKRPVIKLPLPKAIEDDKKVEIKFFINNDIENKIIDFAMEQDLYQVQSFARAQDYIKIFMMSNALLNGRKEVTISDLLLYALVHPLFIKSGKELGKEEYLLHLFKEHPNLPDTELLKKCMFSKPTFYKYKEILKKKGLI